MTVLFATYQSIDVVAKAQADGGFGPFDLVVCDEAHRTTGATLAGEDESAFVRVHDNDHLPARTRIRMTATPRIFDDASKAGGVGATPRKHSRRVRPAGCVGEAIS